MSSNKDSDKFYIETDFAVRYAETDAMGVVHHSGYLVYFEEARSQYMRDMGHDYALIEKDGFRLPVTETQLRYSGSLYYGQRVRVRAWIEENRSRRLKFVYEVRSGDDDAVLVTGYTYHVWTDASGKVTRIPDSLMQLFSRNR
ncbi:MAG: acyl-CoA thioesterase [Pseudohongiellaceae bacterium]